MKFQVEYEIPPLRAIYWKEVEAENIWDAKQAVLQTVPFAKVRAVQILPEEKP